MSWTKGAMSMAPLDFTSLFAPGLPPPAAKWNGFAEYNFIGGHNDADQVPLEALIKAANDVLTREGSHAGDLWSVQRAAGLSSIAGIFSPQARAHRRYSLRCRRDPHHFRVIAGARSCERNSAHARRDRDRRAGDLSRCAHPPAASRRRSHRHSARRRGYAHRRAGRGARWSQAPRRAAQIHLHGADGAESDRNDLERSAPARNAPTRGAIRRADL